jgi:hypothetical protein
MGKTSLFGLGDPRLEIGFGESGPCVTIPREQFDMATSFGAEFRFRQNLRISCGEALYFFAWQRWKRSRTV